MSEAFCHLLDKVVAYLLIPRTKRVDIVSAELQRIVAPVALLGVEHKRKPRLRQPPVDGGSGNILRAEPFKKALHGIIMSMESRIVYYHLCRLKVKRSRNAEMLAVAHGSHGKIMLFGKRTGKNITAAGTYRRASHHIPPIVLLGIGAAPAHIGGKHIGRHAKLPAVAALHKCGVGKHHRRVGRRKCVVVTAVGAHLVHRILQQIRRSESGGR